MIIKVDTLLTTPSADVSIAHNVAFAEIIKQIVNRRSAVVATKSTAKLRALSAEDLHDSYTVMVPRLDTPLVVCKADGP
jgi:hypothetical protein